VEEDREVREGVEGASQGWFSRSVCLVLDDWRYTLFWLKQWMTGCIVKNKYSRLFPLSMDVKVEDYTNYAACDQSFEGGFVRLENYTKSVTSKGQPC
jgi:hypothetical protein